MNRKDLLIAGGALSLQSCIGIPTASSLAPQGRELDCTGKLWKFVRSGHMSKAGGISSAIAYHKQGSDCTYSNVGGFELNFLAGRGGWIRDDMTFHALGYKTTFQLSELESTFYPGSIIDLFEDWYFTVNHNRTGGALYNGDNQVLAVSESDRQLTWTKITFYGGGATGKTWFHRWGNTWHRGQDPNVSLACIGALASEFGCSVSFVVTALLPILGPLDWLALIGSGAGIMGSAAVVLTECSK